MILALLVSIAFADLGRLQELNNGVFRSSQPKDEDIQELCDLGIRNIISLDGSDESLNISKCNGMKIIFNESQDVKVPLTKDFLRFFDQAVSNGNVLFHCSCGCHRTGRLAAWYRMKYQGWTSEMAIEEMRDIGKYMHFFKMLPHQVRAMEDFLLGRECSEKSKYCVK